MQTSQALSPPADPELKELDPAGIRALRGERSRAVFGRLVGVTPQTVYRWELPDGAREARRPRGPERHRLEALRASETARTPSAREPAAPRATEREPAERLAPSPALDEDLSQVLPSIERLLHGDHRRAHGELVQLVATSRGLSANARATAAFGIALYEIVQRSDARGASIAIAGALTDAEAGRLAAAVAARVYAAAALVHAWADGMLFDVGRVHAYAARVEALASGTDQDASCLASFATLCAATMAGDRELLERAFARMEESRASELSPLLAIHVEEFRTVKPMLFGRAPASLETLEALSRRAEELGYTLVLARTLSRLALSELDNLEDPEKVLERARRAKAIVSSGRVGYGIHQVHALKAELEALVRLGRAEEALAALAEIETWCRETGMPAHATVTVQARVLGLAGRTDGLLSLAARLRQIENPALRPICGASASFAEAQAALVTSEDPAATIAMFDQAESEAARWPLLYRDVLLQRAVAFAAAGDQAGGRVALRRAQRCVDSFPSAWFSAQLLRLEAGFRASGGRWNEARQLLESSAATFALAHDKCDAALTRYLLALLTNVFESPNPEAVQTVRRELESYGIVPPHSMTRGVARFGEQGAGKTAESSRSSFGVDQLVVPLRRVSVRGAAPNLILREFVSVVSDLFPSQRVFLEELDSNGAARSLCGESPPDRAAVEWSEFSDGAGRVLRIGVAGVLDPGARAGLSILVTAAALALEAATLRSFGERPEPGVTDDRVPELPGFVAASAEMRKLKVELVRLASSLATVIITGESGVGKEVVARAIHDLSERAGSSYVAFNCATVPRDLFEGQLFGFRRGAFTGAATDQPGVIRAANGGTLFLDEIGELPLDIQPKLLRFLENGEVFPLGERKPVRVDVRILAATHRDLAALVREGRFREDLYYRLQVVPIHVPPLRDRREDIPVLARHFIRDLSRRGEPPVLAPDAISALMSHRWPGNVRELRNVIERVLAFSPAPTVLRAEHLRLPSDEQMAVSRNGG
ncbi:MAG TPA: sigma 54-interacting transcriptional regulator [Polyangiaceae bacterium]|nr:sigma 54-interacting transcriptional regulator [Polyangiaceae bacterium]